MKNIFYILSLCLLVATPAAWADSKVCQNVVIVLDNSGSMGESMNDGTQKIDAAKKALITVLGKLPNDSNVGLLVLNGGWIIPLGPLDKNKLTASVNSMVANGNTPLGEYMKIGMDAVVKQWEKQRYGWYQLLIVTDGEATDPSTFDKNLPDMLRKGVRIDTIGCMMKQDHPLAKYAKSYRKADDSAALEQAISQTFAESTGGKSGDVSDYDMIAPPTSAIGSSYNRHIGQS